MRFEWTDDSTVWLPKRPITRAIIQILIPFASVLVAVVFLHVIKGPPPLLASAIIIGLGLFIGIVLAIGDRAVVARETKHVVIDETGIHGRQEGKEFHFNYCDIAGFEVGALTRGWFDVHLLEWGAYTSIEFCDGEVEVRWESTPARFRLIVPSQISIEELSNYLVEQLARDHGYVPPPPRSHEAETLLAINVEITGAALNVQLIDAERLCLTRTDISEARRFTSPFSGSIVKFLYLVDGRRLYFTDSVDFETIESWVRGGASCTIEP